MIPLIVETLNSSKSHLLIKYSKGGQLTKGEASTCFCVFQNVVKMDVSFKSKGCPF